MTGATNMNGAYALANDHGFNTSFASYPSLGAGRGDENSNPNPVRYVEVYSEVRTRYSQVFWTMSDTIPFPENFLARFGNSTIAIVGYEADQVQRTPEGDVPVPITWAYNHHYMGRVLGKYTQLRQVKVRSPQHQQQHQHQHQDPMAMGEAATVSTWVDTPPPGGHTSPMGSFWVGESVGQDPTPDSQIPTLQGFDEANGGEWRKSFHGYPHGYAQLLEKPRGFRLEPMQIDTRNRDGSMEKPGDGFHLGPIPKNYRAPREGPDAVYSGLLECPCTTRITRLTQPAYELRTDGGSCSSGGAGAAAQTDDMIRSASKCFEAVQSSFRSKFPTDAVFRNLTVSETSLPPGCSLTARLLGTALADAAPPAIAAKNAADLLVVAEGAAPTAAASHERPQQHQQQRQVVSVIFNTDSSSVVPCGAGGGSGSNQTHHPEQELGSATGVVNLTLELNGAVLPEGLARITASGPADVWFGFALGAKQMADQPNAVIIDGEGRVSERKLGEHAPGASIPTQVHVVSNVVLDGVRTVILERGFRGLTPEHISFDVNKTGGLGFIAAVGSGPSLAYHRAKTAGQLVLVAQGVPNCVCAAPRPFGQGNGYIVYTHDDGAQESVAFGPGGGRGGRCPPRPRSDLLETRNPTCDVRTYQGGLMCCHHGWLLTDKEQAAQVPSDIFAYHMKFRIWFQEYVPADPARGTPASHQNLVRFYYDFGCGEYDVLRSPEGTPPNERVQRNEAHWQVKDMLRPGSLRNSVYHTGLPNATQVGVKLIYANGHCHAASCISLELYNNDTGELLCRQVGHMGRTRNPDTVRGADYDEAGYVTIPPCLWGEGSPGLLPPRLLTWETNLTSVKRTNSTYGHTGEMAHWQMRGVLVGPEEETAGLLPPSAPRVRAPRSPHGAAPAPGEPELFV